MKLTSLALLGLFTTAAWGQGVVLTQQDRDNSEVLNLINKASINKCPAGYKKEFLKMGRLNIQIDASYVAKSDNQDFVTVLPKADGSNEVGLHYCAPTRVAWKNGKQVNESIPVEHYSFRLGNLRKRDNCAFSDIQAGTVELRLQGSYYPMRIQLRPILGTEAEKKEYKKLCDNRSRSAKIQDDQVICDNPEDSEISDLTNDVSEVVKKEYSCDIEDLISGHSVIGAGTKVRLDGVKKVAEIITIAGYPPFDERVTSVLKKDTKSSSYRFATQNMQESFKLEDGDSGIFTRETSWNGVKRKQAFRCTLSN